MQVMTLTNLQLSILLYAILFFFSFAEVLRHLVMKNKRTRGKAVGFSSGLLHIPSISGAIYGLKMERNYREIKRGYVQLSFKSSHLVLTFKRRNKTSCLPSLIVWNQSLERSGNVPVDKYSAHLTRGVVGKSILEGKMHGKKGGERIRRP